MSDFSSRPCLHPDSSGLPSVVRALRVPQRLYIMELNFLKYYGNEGEREYEYIHFPFHLIPIFNPNAGIEICEAGIVKKHSSASLFLCGLCERLIKPF